MIDGTASIVPVLLGALLLDAVLGDLPALFRRVPHPVALVGRMIERMDTRLNRPERPAADRRIRGAFALLVVAAAAAAAGWALSLLGWLPTLLLAFLLIAQRGLHDHVSAVAAGLDAGLEQGREAVSHVAGRDPASLDAHGVARAGIESLAENFSDSVVAPAFWFLLLGLPGLCAFKAVNTLDSMIGHRTQRHEAFGAWSARADDIACFLPARISALLLMGAAFCFRRASPLGAWRAVMNDAHRHRSPNAGWPEAAMAGALGLALAGSRRYGGRTVEDAWMGRGRSRATTGDIRRALRLFIAACALHACLLAALWATG
ncbi:MAG: adenosylcobinamide-phosphate synthase CbiB [Alphaproteobacteria bacterium]|nr:adenosylcobinamide-phosphate synthase CbiB [Alphaproteobacteria bacterium]